MVKAVDSSVNRGASPSPVRGGGCDTGKVIRLAGLVLVALLVLACSGGDDAAEPAASPSVTAVSTPRPGSTAVPGTTAQPTIALDSFDPEVQLKGVYRPPQEVAAASVVELPARPKAQFAAWDGASVVIYDTTTGEAHDFGPGSLAQPAFGKNHLVFTSADYEVYAVDLRTMEKKSVGHGVLAYFLGDNYIVINPGNNNYYGYDVLTNKRVDLDEITQPLLQSMLLQRWGGIFLAKWLDGRYAVRLAENPQDVCENTGAEQRACVADVSSKWLVEDVQTQKIVMAFEANKVAPAGHNEVVMATTPVCYEASWITDCYDVLSKLEAQSSSSGGQVAVEGTTNIFLVDLTTGDATFVATATYNASTGLWPMNWPLVANKDFVAWTESYCGDPKGVTRIYNRATGEITELDRGDWLVLADGRLGLGEQGATAIIDPGTLAYLAVLPELSGVSWSSDLRYAAVGQGFGRGSVCE